MSTKKLIKREQRKKRQSQNNKHYINGNDLWRELTQCSKNEKISPTAIDYFRLLAEKLSTSDEFHYRHDEDREDCIAGGVSDAVSYWQNFIPYNKGLYTDLIDHDLMEVNSYEFYDKQYDPSKSLAPYKVWVDIDGESLLMYRYNTEKGEGIDPEKREVTYVGYRGITPEVIKHFTEKLSHKFMSLKTIKKRDKYVSVDCGSFKFYAPTKAELKEYYEIFIDKFAKQNDDARRVKKFFNEIAERTDDGWVATFTPPPFMDYIKKNDGNYELRELRQKVLKSVDYKFYDKDGNEVAEPDESQRIQMMAQDVYPLVQWLPHQKHIREQLYKHNHIKDIDISDMADEQTVKDFENIKALYEDKPDLTSNAFSYITQIIKIGFFKQWNIITKLSYADKVSLNTASANNGFFSI